MLLSSLGIVYGFFHDHAWMTYPCMALVGVGFRLRQQGRRWGLRTAQEITELAESADLVVAEAPFILYLRGFEVDSRTRGMLPHGQLTVLNMPKLSEEELLVRALSDVAPVVAIGDPADALPQLGAKRVYYRERGSGWKKVASELIHTASLVVITTGDSGGLDWEYEHVQADLPLERLLIIVCGDGHHYERFRQRARARGYFHHRELPEWPTMLSLYDRRAIRAAVRFEMDGTPSLEPLVFNTGWSSRTSALETSLRKRVIDRWRSELADGLTRPSGSTWPCRFEVYADGSQVPLAVRTQNPQTGAVTHRPATVRGFDGEVTAYEDHVEIAYNRKEQGSLRATLGSRRYPYSSLTGVQLDLTSPVGQQSLRLTVREGADLLKPLVDHVTTWEDLNSLLIRPDAQKQAAAVSEQIGRRIVEASAHTHAFVHSGSQPYVAEGSHGWTVFDGENVRLSFSIAAPPAKRGRSTTIPLAEIAEVLYQHRWFKGTFRILRRGRSFSSLPDLKEDIDSMDCLPPREHWVVLVAAIKTAIAKTDL
ncbi:DUF4429 domain-containing protein [Streptomyces sp. NPDC003697]